MSDDFERENEKTMDGIKYGGMRVFSNNCTSNRTVKGG